MTDKRFPVKTKKENIRGIIDSTASVFFRIGKDDDVFIRYSRQRIVYGFDTGGCQIPVSYTHLDVYKRQALEYGLPVVLHCREAFDHIYNVLKLYQLSLIHI